jgi:hypothetical protein
VLLGVLSARARNRRNVASAFVGEVVAAMETIEEHADIRRLRRFQSGAQDALPDFSDFQLPTLTVYETNIGQLTLFDAPLPRELTYFYTRFMALPIRLRMLKSPESLSTEDIKERVRDAIADVAQTMSLGENLLHSFRRFISRKQPDSISRA